MVGRFSRWWICLAVAAGASAHTGAAQAQTALTLRDVLATALAHNPDVLTARAAIDSAVGEQRIARALPNPTLNAIPNSPYQYGVSLPLDVGPARQARTHASGAGRIATEQNYSDVVRQVTFGVRQAFYDLLLAIDERDIAAEVRGIFRQLLAADSVRLESGDVPPRNVDKSALELARADAGLATADAAVRAARLRLQALMGVAKPDTGFQVSGSLTYRALDLQSDSLLAVAERNRPDLAAARARVEQSRALRRLAAGAFVPVPTVSLVWQPDGPYVPPTFWTIGHEQRLAFGVGLTVPLFDQNNGERQRAEAGLTAARIAVTRAENAVRSDLVISQDAFNAANALAERYEGGLLAAAARSLDEARYAYSAGALSLLDLLDAVRTYTEIRADAATALHDYWVSAAALSEAAGKDVLPE